MGGESDAPVVKAISKSVIHRICSGQVILDLSSAVKELVENSLDAGATSVEISLKEYGEESFKVVDNGCGISPNNFKALALKHHTSKIADFSDLHSLTTFGFRGEALSSLCALGNLTIETRTKNETVGTHLTFDHSGLVTTERKTARQVGTTVTIEKLFSTLPVRSKEFNRNIRREYGKLVSLLNAYALIAKGIRLLCTNTTSKNSKSVVLKTQGSRSLKDNIITVFGLNTFQSLEPFSLCVSESCNVEGFLSKPGCGSGRNLGDRQFFYVNGRPVDMPKVSKLVNELYKCSNSKQYPIAILNFIIPTTSYDVNVTPDKRKIFFSDEGSLMHSLRAAIEKMYSPNQCSYSVNRAEEPEKGTDIFNSCAYHEDGDPFRASKPLSPAGGGQTENELLLLDNHSPKLLQDGQKEYEELVLDNRSPKLLQVLSQDSHEENGIDQGFEKSLSKSISHDDKDVSNNLSAYRFTHSRNFLKSSAKIDGKTTNHARSMKKDICSQSNIVQSSLMKFVAVSKRKREDCSVLSEVPVLRNEMFSCQGRRTCSELDASVSKSSIYDIRKDDSPEENTEKLLQHPTPSIVSTREETSKTSECDLHDEESGGKSGIQNFPTSLVDATSESFIINDMEMKSAEPSGLTTFSEPLDETNDTLKPCSSSRIYLSFQFSMSDLRRRRQQRLLKLCSINSSCDEQKIGRRYAAATLENFQPENDEGKAQCLAAATIELDRFFKKEDFGRMQVVGQFNLGFIIGKLDQDLFIVDQHAADEKCNFERFSQSTIFNIQPLLQPMRLELSPEEEVVASMNMELIRKNGFLLVEDAHAPPGHHFLLKAVPFSRNITLGAEDVKELISTLADSQGDCSIIGSYKLDTSDSICPSRVRALLASRACRKSVMIGDPLTNSEMQKIIYNLADLRSPWNCPHGRPTMRHLADLNAIHNVRLKAE